MLRSKTYDIPKTDLEEVYETDSIQEGLDTIRDALQKASQLLDDLEREKMLGRALRRFAGELADAVGNVANDLNCDGMEENRRDWARAMLVDAQSELKLQSSDENQIHWDNRVDHQLTHVRFQDNSAARSLSILSENEIITAIDMAQSILIDIEESLRNISEDDAEEIAEVGIVVAKMFVWSLQNFHSQLSPNLLKGTQTSHSQSLGFVEVIEEQSEDSLSQHSDRNSPANPHRFRCLWPPIGPATLSLASWGKDEAMKRPILSIALAMTLWPSALIGAFIGVPILAADWCLQSTYDTLKDTPLIESAEMGASNLLEVGRFYYLCSKLVVKQSVRVGKRQIERRGGIEHVARDVGDWTIDKILHPIATMGMMLDTAQWCVGAAVGSALFIKDLATGEVQIPVPE